MQFSHAIFLDEESQLKVADFLPGKPIPEKILVIFPGALGDFVCFLPTLKKLATEGAVDLLARKEYADLLTPAVSVQSLERREITRLFVPQADRDGELQRFFGSYAAIYSWTGSKQPDFVRNLALLCRGRLQIFPFLPRDWRMHTADYYLSCLGEKDPGDNFPAISLSSVPLAWGERFWRQNGLEQRRVLALAPGSGAREKNWPVLFYHAVARWWEEKIGGKVVIILGPAEEERGELEHSWGEGIVVRSLGLGSVAVLLTQCDLYLGNDSGVTHLAAALGIETVALFGPTDFLQWAPRGKSVTVITRGLECSPCIHAVTKRCPDRRCLSELFPQEVIDILEEVGRKPSRHDGIEVTALTRGGTRIKVKTKCERRFNARESFPYGG